VSYPVVDYQYGSYEHLLSETGAVLGYGRNIDSWTREKRGTANACVQQGIRSFYAPVPLEGEKYAHEWSFLRPRRQLTTVESTYVYVLPPDFAALDGPITFTPDQSVLYDPIQVVSEYELRRRQQETDTTGRPTIAALVTSAIPGRYELHFWLTPDDAYVLDYVCQINPVDLSESNPLPHGGLVHVQTILEACLKAAEEEKQVASGPHAREYVRRLAASISADRKLMCPRSIGRNRDRSEDTYDRRAVDADVVLYAGSEWD
jgi:hypothetical protein